MNGSYEASFATLTNGICAYGFEPDDVHLPSVSHPGAVVISAALALGEKEESMICNRYWQKDQRSQCSSVKRLSES